jgi:hypothetical protein
MNSTSASYSTQDSGYPPAVRLLTTRVVGMYLFDSMTASKDTLTQSKLGEWYATLLRSPVSGGLVLSDWDCNSIASCIDQAESDEL